MGFLYKCTKEAAERGPLPWPSVRLLLFYAPRSQSVGTHGSAGSTVWKLSDVDWEHGPLGWVWCSNLEGATEAITSHFFSQVEGALMRAGASEFVVFILRVHSATRTTGEWRMN